MSIYTKNSELFQRAVIYNYVFTLMQVSGNSHERTQRSVSPSSEPPYAKPQKRTPSQSSAPSTPAAPQREELESMLGNLHEDMKSQGVTTKTKGVCGACNQPVIGQVGCLYKFGVG